MPVIQDGEAQQLDVGRLMDKEEVDPLWPLVGLPEGGVRYLMVAILEVIRKEPRYVLHAGAWLDEHLVRLLLGGTVEVTTEKQGCLGFLTAARLPFACEFDNETRTVFPGELASVVEMGGHDDNESTRLLVPKGSHRDDSLKGCIPAL